MKLEKSGKITLEVEVGAIGLNGFWLMIGNKEHFLGYKEFPWFINVSDSEIRDVELLSDRHLYWPKLDIDLAVESIEHPERFPLIAK